jgi:hypothetical protein
MHAGQLHAHHALSPWHTSHRRHRSADGGMAMAAAAAVPLLPGNGLTDLFTNRVFLVGFWAWFTAQTLKVRVRVSYGMRLGAPAAC